MGALAVEFQNESLVADGTLPPDLTQVTPRTLETERKRLLDATMHRIRAIRDNPAPPDFFNTVEPLEFVLRPFRTLHGLALTMEASTQAGDAFSEVESRIDTDKLWLSHHVDYDDKIFERVAAVHRSPAERAKLNSDQVRLLDLTYDCFVANGAALSDGEKLEKQRIEFALHDLGNSFAANAKSDDKAANLALIPKILRLETSLARLHGHDNYAQMVANEGLGGSAEKILPFLRDLYNGYDAAAHRPHPDAPATRLGDIVFSYADVQERLAQVVRDKFGVEIVRQRDNRHPNPDIQLYTVSDIESGRTFGHAFVKPFAIDDKDGSCCAYTIQKHAVEDGQESLPAGMLSYSFPKGDPGEPAPLNFRRVELYFHEWGHLLETMLSQTPYPSLAGWSPDADELFSTLMENLVSRPETISGVARDRQGNILSPDCIAAAVRFDRFEKADYYNYQQKCALFDLAAHSIPADETTDIDEIIQCVARDTGLDQDFLRREMPRSRHSFGDFRPSYGSRYYAYPLDAAAAETAIESMSEHGGILNKPDSRDRARELFSSNVRSAETADAFRQRFGTDPQPGILLRIYETPPGIRPPAP